MSENPTLHTSEGIATVVKAAIGGAIYYGLGTIMGDWWLGNATRWFGIFVWLLGAALALMVAGTWIAVRRSERGESQ